MNLSSPVTVYSSPGCHRCHLTVLAFRRLGVEPTVVDVSSDDGAAQRLRDAGHTELPVVTAGHRTWTGFRNDLIRETAGMMTSAVA